LNAGGRRKPIKVRLLSWANSIARVEDAETEATIAKFQPIALLHDLE
jgi:hypothetical protein